ncbi:hypothetical protein M427DRAFT_140088 [Gonapodya prolifera JEL478]|uniref:Uncharacterized protein n=1 Tax=Gonapodya prolifera (strain JEL478) TaxID=1344416 RepID=A0A138ZZU1_GONPJ|nr:hypothetical protein M427DRAFT_140088 [Gonapodya prolifera JEL478]|eukprot:KXS10021.1 hypothetical protein M427DRAFT_140088 [Gonapodya prolifera JEL478]
MPVRKISSLFSYLIVTVLAALVLAHGATAARTRMYYLMTCGTTNHVAMFDSASGSTTGGPTALFSVLVCVNPTPAKGGGNCAYENDDLDESVTLEFVPGWKSLSLGTYAGYASFSGSPFGGKRTDCYTSVKNIALYSDQGQKCYTQAFCIVQM